MNAPISRIRTSGEFENYTLTNTRTMKNGDVDVSNITLDEQAGQTKYMYDWVTPNFSYKSARGKVINKPMHSIQTERTTTLSTMQRSYTLNGTVEWDHVFSMDPHLTRDGTPPNMGQANHLFIDIDQHQLRTLAGTSAQGNINPPEFEGVVFVAELAETLGFLLSPLRAYQKWLKRKLRQARRKKRKRTLGVDAKTLAEYISTGWLGFRYGAMPIIYDVQDAIAAITALEEITNRATARGYSTNHGTASDDQQQIAAWMQNDKHLETTRKVEVRAGILYTTDVKDTFGMHMRQIPKAVWEVVPFSFVADWFLNINDYIDAITPKAGIKILSSWTTTIITDTTEANGIGSPGSDPITWVLTQAGSSSESLITRDYSRSPTHTVGIASRPIPYEGDIGVKRLTDSLSLIFLLLKEKI